MEYATHMIGQGEDLWEKAHNTVAGVVVGTQGLLRSAGILSRGGDVVPNDGGESSSDVFVELRKKGKEQSKKNVPVNPFKPLEKVALKFLTNGLV